MAKVDQDGLDDTSEDQKSVSVTVNNSAESGSSSGSVDDAPEQEDRSVSTEFYTRKVPLAEKERWFKTYWRPLSAYVYLFINLFDFVIAPVMSMLMPKITGTPAVPWVSLTLSNGGLFHLAFGAIIGVTAWGRTKERLNGVGPADNG